MTFNHWDQLTFWQSGEWQTLCERFDIMDAKHHNYWPSRSDMFKALEYTPFDKVKVLLMGQDPYPDPRHATGLSFSVPNTIKKVPQSLKNILMEYEKDLGLRAPRRDDGTYKGDLSQWAFSGVLMWNAVPVFYESEKERKQNEWEWTDLTNEIVQKCMEKDEGIVFMFWGARAQQFITKIDTKKHRIIRCVHPSPRSAKKGWFGSRPFTTCNIFLEELGHDKIDWDLNRSIRAKKSVAEVLDGVFEINPPTPEYIYAEESEQRTDTDSVGTQCA